MNAPTRLAAFAALLSLGFAAAAFAGDRIDWTPRAADKTDGEPHEMAAAPAGDHAVPGLAVSDDGLTLDLDRTRVVRNRDAQLRFRILDDHGRPVRAFDVEHTKRMHVIVVRRDLTGFQHLHPTLGRDGTWQVPLRLRDAGTYRVFADFATKGTKHTLGADLSVDGPVTTRPLPAAASTTTVDGYRVTLDAGRADELRFAVTRDGRPVEVEPYLGARGHLVALRDGDLAYLHVHPDEDRLAFMTEYPSAGRYRLFLQFRAAGRVHTAAFTQEVTS